MPYRKCPRCQLNYIPDTDAYCKVCLVDMGKLAANNLLEELDDDLPLCPSCGENYLEEGETLCFACRTARLKPAEKEEEEPKEFTPSSFAEDREEDDLPEIETSEEEIDLPPEEFEEDAEEDAEEELSAEEFEEGEEGGFAEPGEDFEEDED